MTYTRGKTEVFDSEITSSGLIGSITTGGKLYITDSILKTTTEGVKAFYVAGSNTVNQDSELVVTGGTIITNGGPVLSIEVLNGSRASATFDNVDTSGAGGIIVPELAFNGRPTDGTVDITIIGGSGLNGDTNAYAGAINS